MLTMVCFHIVQTTESTESFELNSNEDMGNEDINGEDMGDEDMGDEDMDGVLKKGEEEIDQYLRGILAAADKGKFYSVT